MTRVRRAAKAGYTIVELMMSLTVLAIGVTGIVAMQQVTVVANQHAKNLAIGTHIAQAWLDRLVADAAQWNHPSSLQPTSDLDQTRWLDNVNTSADTWFRPDYEAALEFGPSFDALGDVVSDADVAMSVYCTHLRLNWLFPGNQGNGLIRAEVRVFWAKQGVGGIDNQPICDPNGNVGNIGSAINNYHFVYMTTAIRQNQARPR